MDVMKAAAVILIAALVISLPQFNDILHPSNIMIQQNSVNSTTIAPTSIYTDNYYYANGTALNVATDDDSIYALQTDLASNATAINTLQTDLGTNATAIDTLQSYLNINPYVIYPISGIGSTSRVSTAKRVQLSAFYIRSNCYIHKISFQCLTGSSGKNSRLSLYADNGGTPYGGALLAESGNIDMTGTGLKTWDLTTHISVTAGSIVWVGYEAEDGTMATSCGSTYAWSTSMVDGCYYDLANFGAFTNPCPSVTYGTIRTSYGMETVLTP